MIVLYIFLGILAFIGLILFLPIGIGLHYDGESGFRFRLSFAWIPLFDSGKPKEDKPTEEKPKEDKPKESKSKDKKKSSGGAAQSLLSFLGLGDIASIANAKRALEQKGAMQLLADLRSAIGAILTRVGQLIGRGVFREFTLRVVVGDEDAADAAMTYGQICGVVYPLITMADSAFTFRRRTVDLRCDFARESIAVTFDGRLQYRPWNFIQFLWGLIKNYFKRSVN